MHSAFAAALHGRRDEFNARFAHARRLRPELDGEAFKAFFAQSTEALVMRVQQLDPAAVDALVCSAYDIALELVAQRLVGPAAPLSAITRGWQELAPAAGQFLRDQPHAVLRALSNALHHLGGYGAAAVTRWLTVQQGCLPLCSDLDLWLRAGQVSSWLCGMAHYRAPALRLLADMQPALQRALLDLPADADSTAVLAELALSPWSVPGQASPGRKPQVIRQIGGFTGFGGPFLCPPVVAACGADLYLRAGEHCWALFVDAWGEHLQRITAERFQDAALAQSLLPAGWSLHGADLRVGKHVLNFSAAGALSSYACNGHTVLLSHSASHRISVIAVRA
jgi:hypothetical protein